MRWVEPRGSSLLCLNQAENRFETLTNPISYRNLASLPAMAPALRLFPVVCILLLAGSGSSTLRLHPPCNAQSFELYLVHYCIYVGLYDDSRTL